MMLGWGQRFICTYYGALYIHAVSGYARDAGGTVSVSLE